MFKCRGFYFYFLAEVSDLSWVLIKLKVHHIIGTSKYVMFKLMISCRVYIYIYSRSIGVIIILIKVAIGMEFEFICIRIYHDDIEIITTTSCIPTSYLLPST